MVCALTHHSFFFLALSARRPSWPTLPLLLPPPLTPRRLLWTRTLGGRWICTGRCESGVWRERGGERAALRRFPSPLPVFFFSFSNLLLPHQQHTKALSAAPADPDLLAARAQAHLKLGHWLEAADDARRACDLEPGLAKAWARRGCVFFFVLECGARKGGGGRVRAHPTRREAVFVWGGTSLSRRRRRSATPPGAGLAVGGAF